MYLSVGTSRGLKFSRQYFLKTFADRIKSSVESDQQAGIVDNGIV